MHTLQRKFRLSATCIALCSAFGAAQADEEVDALIKPESSVSVGVGQWSGDRHQQGIYDGQRDGKAYGLIDADIVRRDDDSGTWFRLKAHNLGLDNGEISGEYLRQGDIGVSLEYNRISRDNPNTFNTRLQGIGGATQIENSTAGGKMNPVTLGTVREQSNMGFYKNLLPGLDLNIAFKNEDKTGTRPWGRGGSNNFAEFAVEPINANTRQLEAVLNYTTKLFQLSGGYNGSWYDNKYNQVTIAAPGSAVANARNPTYLSVPLDNEAHQLFLNGGYNFSKATRGTFKLEYARATQNERLPGTPSTGSGGGQTLASAPDRLDARVDTKLIQLGLTSRPVQNLSVNANLRYHHMEDKTPVRNFASAGDSPDYVPFSYKTFTGKVEGTYRLDEAYSLTAGLEEKRQDRKLPVTVAGTLKDVVVPMRQDLNETTARLELRRTLSETLNGSLSYVHAKRDGGRYHAADVVSSNGVVNIENQVNPLNIADRERDKVRASFDWAPSEVLSLQFNLEQGQDKYKTSHNTTPDYGAGLSSGKSQLYSVDGAWTVNDRLKLTAWYAYDQSKARQSALRADNGGGNAGIKSYDLQDSGNSLGIGMRLEATSRLNLGANLEWTSTVSKYNQSMATFNGAAATYPANFDAGLEDIKNRMVRLSLFSVYALDKKSDLRLDFIHERWKTNDWSWLYANGTAFTYGNAAGLDGTYVTADPKQISNFVAMRYIYKFQ